MKKNWRESEVVSRAGIWKGRLCAPQMERVTSSKI